MKNSQSQTQRDLEIISHLNLSCTFTSVRFLVKKFIHLYPFMVRMSMLMRNRGPYRAQSKLPPTSPWSKRIELKVPLCCEDCEENVRGQLIKLECVKDINFDTSSQKVVVIGHYDVILEPSVVLNAVKKVKNRAELWKSNKNIQALT